jgi:hypothetical protein
MKTIIENPDGSVTIDGQTFYPGNAEGTKPTPVTTQPSETPKPKLPERWGELGTVSGVFINGVTSEPSVFGTSVCEKSSKNTFANRTYLQSALAFAQLSQLYEAWKRIEFPDWKADWSDQNQIKVCPLIEGRKLSAIRRWVDLRHFPLPPGELCQKFIDCPEIASLLRTFYMIEE